VEKKPTGKNFSSRKSVGKKNPGGNKGEKGHRREGRAKTTLRSNKTRKTSAAHSLLLRDRKNTAQKSWGGAFQ